MGLSHRSLARAAVRVVRPLIRDFTDPRRFQRLMARLGWPAVGLPAAYVAAADDARALLVRVQGWTAAAPEIADVVLTVADVRTLVEGLAALPPPPGVADAAAFAEDLSVALPDLLLHDALRWSSPALLRFLRHTGAITTDEVTGAGRTPHRRPRIDWDRVQEVIQDPVLAARTASGLDPGSWDPALGVTVLHDVLSATPVPVVRSLTDDRVVSPTPRLSLVVLEVPAGEVTLHLDLLDDDDGPGLRLVLDLPDGVTATLPVSDVIALTVAGEVGGDLAPSLTLPLQGAPNVDVGDLTGDPQVSLAAAVSPAAPFVLVGAAGATRLELAGLDLAAGLSLGTTPDAWVAGALHGLDLVIAAGETDTFLQALLGEEELRLGSDVALRYGTSSGFSASGELGIRLDLPLDLTLGPVTLERLGILAGLRIDDDGMRIAAQVDADLGASLLIFAARVEGIGLALELTPEGGGAPDVALGLVGPTAVGLSVDAAGVVTGGGFISVDRDLGRYAGALSITVIAVGIDALVVVDTQPPGGGWALFASLTARFPSIQLGFGFALTGVGGIVALHRTFDPGPFALALRDGVVDAMLFPDDPVNDAPAIIAEIDAYFPLQPGSTVFGPVIQLAWGTPTLIQAQIGVLIALPDGIIALLGSISMALPTPEQALLELNLDVLGVLDIPAGELWVVASLYDSTLLGVIDLSGDAGMFVRIGGGEPYFLLSVGGYHSTFQPPASLPAVFHDLRRMRAAIELADNVSIVLKSFFAVTSNTLQFGAEVRVTAVVKVLTTEYTAEGWLGFETLIQFTPFAVIADLSAGVTVSTKRKQLCGVWLAVHLEGPDPWYAKGTATFDFFGLDVNFRFEVGGTASGGALSRVPVREQVVAELRAASAWEEVTPPWERAELTIAPPDTMEAADEDLVEVRPDAMVAVRQTVAPLDHDLEIVGNARPASGHERLTVTGAGRVLDGQPVALDTQPTTDWFAPAQYEDLKRRERLTRASYEQFESGVSFGDDGVTVPLDEATTVDDAYEEELWEPSTSTGRRRLAHDLVTLDRTVQVLAATAPRLQVQQTTWTTVDEVTGVASGIVGSQTAVRGRQGRMVPVSVVAP